MATPKTGSSNSSPGPRIPVPIPPSLRDTLKILFEEELYLPGFDLLNGLLAQGISRCSDGKTKEQIYIPPPIYISFLTTLLAHPHFTTHIPRTGQADRDFPLLSTHAERLLRRYLALAGARGAGIFDAWRFSSEGGVTRRAAREGSIGVGMVGENSEIFEDDMLDLKFARRDGIFDRADDFWAVVGWGFTCACAKGRGKKEKWMRRRWERAWRRWVTVVVEGLERDWTERGEAEYTPGGQEVAGDAGRKGALIPKYMPDTTGSAGVRRVARAIFANGRGRMGGEWKEVWLGETEGLSLAKARTEAGTAKNKWSKKESKKGSLEEDTGKMGKLGLGVFDESEDDCISDSIDEKEESAEGDSISVRVTPEPSALAPNAADAWGGMDAMVIRRRIISLLLDVCSKNLFPSEVLYEALADHIIPLSIPELSLFITSSTLPADPLAFIPLTSHQKTVLELNKYILDELMESEAPMASDESEEITMKEVVDCYLPYGAKSRKLVDDAKVGLLVEASMRELLKSGGTGGVERSRAVQALEKGIGRRRRASGKITSAKKAEEETMTRKWLEEGEKRLRMLVEVGWCN